MSTRLAKVPTEPRAFIAWENRRKARYELIDGEVRLMAGGSRAHDLVAGNLLALLHARCAARTAMSTAPISRSSRPRAWSPIPTFSCAAARSPMRRSSAMIPLLVFEVLSPSTRSEDLVRKRWAYQAIPGLAHLVYIDAARVAVEIASRAPDRRWWSVFLHELDETLRLEQLGVELALADIYARTRAAAG
jgi:Uma2 family endonuclease